MTAKEERRSDASAELWPLLGAIASGERGRVNRILEARPQLAVESAHRGATRETANAHFLDAIQHYVYAGDTALHIAAAAYASDVVNGLIGLGGNVRARNRMGAEPLHYASVGNPGSPRWDPAAQSAVIEVLIGGGADPNAADRRGTGPLHLAVRTRCAAAVRVLLARGANPRARTRSGSMPLHLAVQTTGRGGSGSEAARMQQEEIVRLLIERGARLDDTDGRGKTADDRMRSRRA